MQLARELQKILLQSVGISEKIDLWSVSVLTVTGKDLAKAHVPVI